MDCKPAGKVGRTITNRKRPIYITITRDLSSDNVLVLVRELVPNPNHFRATTAANQMLPPLHILLRNGIRATTPTPVRPSFVVELREVFERYDLSRTGRGTLVHTTRVVPGTQVGSD